MHFKGQIEALLSNSKPFNSATQAALQLFVPGPVLKAEMELVKQQLPDSEIKSLPEQLPVRRCESLNSIYSELRIDQVRREIELARSNFSELKILYIEGKRIEDAQANPQTIVSKST